MVRLFLTRAGRASFNEVLALSDAQLAELKAHEPNKDAPPRDAIVEAAACSHVSAVPLPSFVLHDDGNGVPKRKWWAMHLAGVACMDASAQAGKLDAQTLEAWREASAEFDEAVQEAAAARAATAGAAAAAAAAAARSGDDDDDSSEPPDHESDDAAQDWTGRSTR